VVDEAVADSGTATFVPVADVFAGHEACGSAGEWINSQSGEVAGKWPPVKPTDQTFHPNAEGQAEYAAIINAYLTPTF